MVILAASICTKNGKILVSRQFLAMSRTRIDGLLSSFPKIVPSGTQHTTVSTEDVRFVYQPLEQLYLVLITSLKSNIIQDMDSLHLFSRAIADICGNAHIDEREINEHSFELLWAFDEIVSFGVRESISLSQLRTIAAMDSNEERIQDLVIKNKEMEAREQMRLKAKQLELEKRQKKSNSTYTIPITPCIPVSVKSPSPTFIPSNKGMKLGSSRDKFNDYSDAFSSLVISEPKVEAKSFSEPVFISISEKLVATVTRDGGIKLFEVRGDLTVHVKAGSACESKIYINVSNILSGTQFKVHPNFDKQVFTSENALELKKQKSYSPNIPSSALKWRFAATDDSMLPFVVNCWPNQGLNNIYEFTVEYELNQLNLEFSNVLIDIPLAAPPLEINCSDGITNYDSIKEIIQWKLDSISQGNSNGSIEFKSQGNISAPIKIHFSCEKSFTNISVNQVFDGANQLDFKLETLFSAEDYSIVNQ